MPANISAALAKVDRPSDLPVCGPNTRAKLDGLIREFEDSLAYSMPGHIEKMLGGVASAFPITQTSPAEARARLETYVAALVDIPPDILNAALKASVQKCKFFPTVKEIRDLAAPELNRRAWQLMALQHMRNRHDREWKPEGELVGGNAVTDLTSDLARKLSSSNGPR